MRRFPLLAANGLIAVLACAGVANAQVDSAGIVGAYPTPLPYNPAGGGYVVAPPLRGAGATYSYEQLNPGASLGRSPTTYFSQNFFGSAPMTPTYPYATGYSAGYVPPGSAYRGTTIYPTQTVPSTTYATMPSGNSVYANANSVYYRNRRSGPLRRLFGR